MEAFLSTFWTLSFALQTRTTDARFCEVDRPKQDTHTSIELSCSSSSVTDMADVARTVWRLTPWRLRHNMSWGPSCHTASCRCALKVMCHGSMRRSWGGSNCSCHVQCWALGHGHGWDKDAEQSVWSVRADARGACRGRWTGRSSRTFPSRCTTPWSKRAALHHCSDALERSRVSIAIDKQPMGGGPWYFIFLSDGHIAEHSFSQEVHHSMSFNSFTFLAGWGSDAKNI